MAKYIIDIPDDMTCLNALRYEDGKCVSARSYIIPDLTPYVRSESYIDGLKEGQNDAWKFARRIICPSDCCEDSISAHTKEIFGKEGWEIRGIFNDLSYQEARAKYDAWKQEKEEIHVGDEVKCRDTNGVVVRIDTEERGVNVVWENGGTAYMGMAYVTKTGRHFPDVENLLKKMGMEVE